MPITMSTTIRPLIAAAAALGVTVSAQAADAPPARPAALVEDVAGTLPGVQPLDYLTAGRTLSLAPGQVLSISYLASCVTETITGGTVTVGMRESTVAGGMVERTAQPCDGGKLVLPAHEAGKAGVSVFRSVPSTALPAADLTLFGTRPVLALPAPGPVAFERLDGERLDGERLDGERPEGEAPTLTVDVAGAFLDMAKGDAALVPGGLYKVTAGNRFLIVRIDPQAKDGGGPALGRLLRF